MTSLLILFLLDLVYLVNRLQSFQEIFLHSFLEGSLW